MTGELSSIELFAGGGGMALGMRLAGFKHLALVEWQKSAAAILRHNSALFPDLWGAEEVIEKDVRSWMSAITFKEVDMVAGGPPCQPFSLAGVHAGDDDERNMFPASIEILRTVRPKVAVFENVPGLTRPSFAPYFRYIKDQIAKPTVLPNSDELWAEHHARITRSKSRGLRYRVYEHQLDAADFGLPQNRRRVFLIAIRSDVVGAETWTAPSPTNSRDSLLHAQWVSGDYWDSHNIPRPEMPSEIASRIATIKEAGEPFAQPWRTVRDAIVGLPTPVEGRENDKIANHRGIAGARAYPSHSGSAFDWPSKTIKAGVHGVSGGEAMIRFDDGSLRYLTVREAARIQGFPDDYEFVGVRSRTMGAIGNAVAAPVAELLARRLISHCKLGQVSDVPTLLRPGFSLRDQFFGHQERQTSSEPDLAMPPGLEASSSN